MAHDDWKGHGSGTLHTRSTNCSKRITDAQLQYWFKLSLKHTVPHSARDCHSNCCHFNIQCCIGDHTPLAACRLDNHVFVNKTSRLRLSHEWLVLCVQIPNHSDQKERTFPFVHVIRKRWLMNMSVNTKQARQAESESPPSLLISLSNYSKYMWAVYFLGPSIYRFHTERGRRRLAKQAVMVREVAWI